MSHHSRFQSIEEILKHANPNPDRVGCLSSAQLQELASGERSAGDHLYLHVSGCSACYSDLLRRRRNARRQKIFWMSAAAAVLMIASSLWYRGTRSAANSPAFVAKAELPLPEMVVDLRPFSIARSGEAAGAKKRLGFQRKKQQFVFVLPVASALGKYDLRLLDGELAPKLVRSASAEMREGSTELSIDLDLTAISAGHYTLALRREPEDWRYFPVDVQ